MKPFSQKTEINKLESEEDEGWRIGTIVAYSMREIQIENTHTYSGMVIPDQDQSGVAPGYKRVSHYTFGAFAYLFAGPSKVMEPMNLEFFCIDFNSATAERGKTSRYEMIRKDAGLRALERIRQIRIQSITQSEGTMFHSFRLFKSNCATYAASISKAAGVDVPTLITLKSSSDSKIVKIFYSIIMKITPLWTFLLWYLGADKKDRSWDFKMDGPYFLRMWMKLKNETDLLNRAIAKKLEEKGNKKSFEKEKQSLKDYRLKAICRV